MELKEKLGNIKESRTNGVIDALQLLQEQIDGQKNISQKQLDKIIAELTSYKSLCMACETLEAVDDKEEHTKLIMSLL